MSLTYNRMPNLVPLGSFGPYVPVTYTRMSNLVHEFFLSIGARNFSVVTHSCPFRHKFAQMDKQELSI